MREHAPGLKLSEHFKFVNNNYINVLKCSKCLNYSLIAVVESHVRRDLSLVTHMHLNFIFKSALYVSNKVGAKFLKP